MKKSKLSLGLVSCLLSVGTLAGCDTLKSSNDGVLLSYTVDGVEGVQKITADEILGDYYNDSTKYQAIYDTIYSVVAKNYFSKERTPTTYEGTPVPLGASQMERIVIDARAKVDDDIDTAKTNADANNTKYKKEFEAILESKGVKSEEELLEKYIEELQKETFENNFYKYQVEEMKNAGNEATDISVKVENAKSIAVNSLVDGSEVFKWNGYFVDQLPYHMSHILVKLADSSDTNYYNGTISEENAIRLADVVNTLSDKNTKFAKTAMTYNEDPGSQKKEGDLGIMDLDTSFINEFKLGIYAYELFYGENKTDAAKSNIKVTTGPGSVESNYKSTVKTLFDLDNEDDIPTVELSVFNELKSVAKETSDNNKKPVIENATLVYPRNIIYNKYLNRHAVFFIEDATATGTDNFVLNWNNTGKNILCADGDKTKPIIAVRASSGGEQEIHLMVINRSPFAKVDKNGSDLIPLTQYYTTYHTGQDYYPRNPDKSFVKTYVNFLTNNEGETKTRAEEFASKLKSYDSDKLGKYIFLKYANEEKIKFADENKALAEALMKWIETSLEKKADEREESWTKTWNEYLDKLVKQNSERKKLVPQACRLVYKKANAKDVNFETALMQALNINPTDADAEDQLKEKDDYKELISLIGQDKYDEFKGQALDRTFKEEGGPCNDGKAHL